MADAKLEQTAEEFRTLVRQAAERGRFAGPASPAVDPENLNAIVRAAVADALAANPPPAAGLDPALVERLEEASQTMGEKAGDGDVLLHLRNVLPGQIRQELQQQAQPTQQRLAGLEQRVAALHADSGWGREIARALLVGVVVAIVVLFSVIFEKQIQEWGRDTIYPLAGIPIKEASPRAPRQASPSTPQERR